MVLQKRVSKIDKEDIVKYLSIGRTIDDIKKQFSITSKEVERLIKHEYSGYDVFTHRDSLDRPIHMILPKEDDFHLKIEPRIWTYRKQLLDATAPDVDLAPYLWIQFPDDLPWDRIIILPTADVHFGQANFNRKRFEAYIDWIRRQENCFTFFLGDVLENALPNSPGGAIFEQSLRPRYQREEFARTAAPIAHKILFTKPGNHEDRSVKLADISPLEFVCRDLGNIPYFDEPVFVNILWKGCVFTFYVKHGRSASRTPGGQINAASRSLTHQEFTMFTVSGHTHGKKSSKETRICRHREFDDEGNLIDFRLIKKKQYVIICPAGFSGFYGTYAHRSEYSPSTQSGVACLLYASGDYHVPMDTKER